MPHSGMPGPPSGPGVAQDEDRVGGDVQRRVVDAGVHVVVVLEDDRGARVREQRRRRGGVLDDAAVGRQGAAQDRQARPRPTAGSSAGG